MNWIMWVLLAVACLWFVGVVLAIITYVTHPDGWDEGWDVPWEGE